MSHKMFIIDPFCTKYINQKSKHLYLPIMLLESNLYCVSVQIAMCQYRECDSDFDRPSICCRKKNAPLLGTSKC